VLARNGRSRIGEVKEMLIPIRCFSCGNVIAQHWPDFKSRTDNDEDPAEVLNDLGVERYCCRRMFVGQVELIDEIAPFTVYRKP
jgi:DNA-directed RNA polymerase subunit N